MSKLKYGSKYEIDGCWWFGGKVSINLLGSSYVTLKITQPEFLKKYKQSIQAQDRA